MEYVFGTSGEIEILKTKGDAHSGLSGYRQVKQEYDDQVVEHRFRVVRLLRSAEDAAGNCYDWYEIDRHTRTADKTGPLEDALDELLAASLEG